MCTRLLPSTFTTQAFNESTSSSLIWVRVSSYFLHLSQSFSAMTIIEIHNIKIVTSSQTRQIDDTYWTRRLLGFRNDTDLTARHHWPPLMFGFQPNRLAKNNGTQTTVELIFQKSTFFIYILLFVNCYIIINRISNWTITVKWLLLHTLKCKR